MRRACEALAISCALAATLPARARADGAFPDSQSVLTPADRPQELILPTNFGLVISEDGGGTWNWSCEQDENALGMLYQLGPAPRRRLFTVANQQLAYTDDASCSWHVAGGLVTSQSITDFFPDPIDANRVLAVGIANTVYSVFASSDGGTTFGTMIYQAAAGDAINGIEISRSDPQTVYLSLTSADSNPKLARSTDGGAHFTITDLTADIGTGILRIIAVDPADPRTVLLRLLRIQTTDQGFAVTHDGGATATTTLTITGGNFTSFVRLPDGTLLLSAMVDSNTVPALYRSRDAGATFAQLPSPAIRALSQRDGIAYAATDNFNVGFALGSSSDEGSTWQPVMAYQQIQAVVSCLRGNAQCQASCDMLAGNNGGTMIWDASVCTANPPPSTGTGGSTGTGTGTAGSSGGAGNGMAGSGAGTSGGGAGGGHPPRSSGGCAVAGDPADPADPAMPGLVTSLLGLAGVAVVIMLGVRRPPWYGRARSLSASASRSSGG